MSASPEPPEMRPATFATLHDLLGPQARADRRVTFIDAEHDQRPVAFSRLRQRAVALLGALQRRGFAPGDTLVLFLADNERFIEMFWACVLGGIVPVPLAAGGNAEHRRKLYRVRAQLGTAAVAIDAPALDRLEAHAAADDALVEAAAVRAVAVVPAGLDLTGAPGVPQAARPDDLAFIQYSSGSTGDPKGVLLSHRNLAVNIAAIVHGAAYTDRDSVLSWMPLSHDMGLIGFHLTLLACEAEHAIMRTELFARRPLLWLALASERRATVLCTPNFGLHHYLRQHALKPPRLDLTAVRLIFDGAEPISAALCRRFMRTLQPQGLRPNCLLAVYGLAEATLAVSFPPLGAPLATVWVERSGLRLGEPVPVRTCDIDPDEAGTEAHRGDDRVEFVELGTAVRGTELRIADAAGAACADGVLGQVQIRGANVSSGYFGASPRAADAWLDTGDLGFCTAGRLVVTGRAKDLIIVNGQNLHAHDIERLAEQVPGVKTQRVAAAAVASADGATEELAVFVVHRAAIADFAPLALALRRHLMQQAGLEAAQIVPVPRLPKTTSGKLQRQALAEAFARGEFDAVRAELAPLLEPPVADPGLHGRDGERADEAAAPGAAGAAGEPAASSLRRLLAICSRVVPAQVFTPQTDLMEIHLNSLTLARIHEAIAADFPDRLEVTDLFDHPRLDHLARFLDGSAK